MAEGAKYDRDHMATQCRDCCAHLWRRRSCARVPHPPIRIGLLLSPCGKLGYQRMTRGKMAYRISGACIAGQGKGLTAAAAEIDFAPLAACARFRQKRR